MSRVRAKERPPLLTNFLDLQLAHELGVPRVRKVVRITSDDIALAHRAAVSSGRGDSTSPSCSRLAHHGSEASAASASRTFGFAEGALAAVRCVPAGRTPGSSRSPPERLRRLFLSLTRTHQVPIGAPDPYPDVWIDSGIRQLVLSERKPEGVSRESRRAGQSRGRSPGATEGLLCASLHTKQPGWLDERELHFR